MYIYIYVCIIKDDSVLLKTKNPYNNILFCFAIIMSIIYNLAIINIYIYNNLENFKTIIFCL